jgi:hypothetical protein
MVKAVDPVFGGMGFDETGRWHKETWVDFWRWGFSDLRDNNMKDTLADVIAKVMLDMGTAAMSDDELEVLRITSLVTANGWPHLGNARAFDA